MLIGLVGTNGSGKSSACSYLKDRGFTVFSLSTIVRQEAAKIGRPLTRDNLIVTGSELKRENGADVLAKKAFDQCGHLPQVVFDSIRHPAEAAYLVQKGVVLVGITAPVEVRYARIFDRKDSTDKIDYDTFLRQDNCENTGKSSGQNILQTMKACRYTLDNGKDVSTFHRKLEVLLTKVSSHV